VGEREEEGEEVLHLIAIAGEQLLEDVVHLSLLRHHCDRHTQLQRQQKAQ
jgi:hypothetical protein